jgi:hypothetical protein
MRRGCDLGAWSSLMLLALELGSDDPIQNRWLNETIGSAYLQSAGYRSFLLALSPAGRALLGTSAEDLLQFPAVSPPRFATRINQAEILGPPPPLPGLAELPLALLAGRLQKQARQQAQISWGRDFERQVEAATITLTQQQTHIARLEDLLIQKNAYIHGLESLCQGLQETARRIERQTTRDWRGKIRRLFHHH